MKNDTTPKNAIRTSEENSHGSANGDQEDGRYTGKTPAGEPVSRGKQGMGRMFSKADIERFWWRSRLYTGEE